MTPNQRTLISSLLTSPEIRELHAKFAESCTEVLTQAGLEREGDPVFFDEDTGVGMMSSQCVTLHEPAANTTIQVFLRLLAKTDGSFQCWTEMWGDVPKNSARDLSLARRAQLQLDSPRDSRLRRLRITRDHLFKGTAGEHWYRRKDALGGFFESLRSQGFFGLLGEAPRHGQYLAQALTP
jgi:hypothetical protein